MKTALITGASRGLGLELTKILYKENYKLILVSKNKDKLFELEKIFNSNKIMLLPCDLSNLSELEDLVLTIKNNISNMQDFDNPSLIINNAGISSYNLFQEEKLSSLTSIINTNLLSHMYLTSSFISNLISKKSGTIVNISSMLTKTNSSMEVSYTTTKYALEGFTKSLSCELGLSNIDVIAFRLGFMNTDMNNNYSTKDLEYIKSKIKDFNKTHPKYSAKFILNVIFNKKYKNGEIIDVPYGWFENNE